jgi:hypothetical protein
MFLPTSGFPSTQLYQSRLTPPRKTRTESGDPAEQRNRSTTPDGAKRNTKSAQVSTFW